MKHTSIQLRKQFLDYFARHHHRVVKSAPLLPQNDPTLLFVNAGMAQFKDVFTGKEKRPYTRATSSQKCVRAGGKHNDLENVGRTARHHTFFEMLGNFSFGDYFKKEACVFAWEFLTKELGIDPNRLSVTVFGGENGLPPDEEAEAIWRDVVGVPANRISRMGAADNFWAMGDTGPCGPCTEIHFDRGDVKNSFGGDDAEGDRLMEIWNLVFMQYERKSDGSLIPLPAPCVDTGMGLERLCTVVNELGSNYDTDLLFPFVKAVSNKIGKPYTSSDEEDDVSMRIIADHCRTTSFLIADSILPSNEGRGYVLRRIMRRAIRHGARLGFEKPFFHEICDLVVDQFGEIYPELKEARQLIQKVVLQEEEAFRRTLSRGLELFESAAQAVKSGALMDGSVVFKLYETYGFPSDLTAVLAEEKGLAIDWERFEKAKVIHEKASSSGLGLAGVSEIYKELAEQLGPSQFIGDEHDSCSAKIVALLKGESSVDSLAQDQEGSVILDQTVFYGESGGQVGDTGILTGTGFEAEVLDTKKIAGLNIHLVRIKKGELKVGTAVQASINTKRRASIMRHHSVTHLLHSALRQTLGEHVIQKGSLVAPDRLRFDYSHFEPMQKKQIQEVEDLVNAWILENKSSEVETVTFDEAKTKGAMALFGEKYGDQVRVVGMGPHSKELCGGTHVHHTGDIGYFRITNESALAAGIRRIEAVAGSVALEYARADQERLSKLESLLESKGDALETRVISLLNSLKQAEKALGGVQQSQLASRASSAAKNAKIVNDVKIITELLEEGVDNKLMSTYADLLRDQVGSGIVVLGAKLSDHKCTVLVAVTKDLITRFHAGQIAAKIAERLGGKGGGRPDFAQAGGTRCEELDSVLKTIGSLLF